MILNLLDESDNSKMLAKFKSQESFSRKKILI